MYTDFDVIDADGHVVEPKGMWHDYIEESYKSRAPRSVGAFSLVVNDRIAPKREGTNRVVPEMGDETKQLFLRKFKDAVAEQFSPERQLKDMTREGIDQAVLYPTQGLFALAQDDLEPKFAAAIARAYNNWLSDFCGHAPGTFFGAAMIPLQDVDEAVAEACRAVRELGMKAVFVRPNPIRGRTLDDRYYDPLYAALEDLDVPLGTHEGMGSLLPTAGADRYTHSYFSHICSHAMETMLACLSIVGGGVLERFPNLTVAFLEAGCGWLPYWLERMDEHTEWVGGVNWLKKKPSEYFLRQCYIGCEAGEESLPQVVQLLGDRNIVFASDYPHPDAKFPDTVKATVALDGLSQDAKRAIMRDNAQRLYRL